MQLSQQIFSLLLPLVAQSNANLSQMPFWLAVGYCMLHWDFKLSCQYRSCWQRIQCHTVMSESQMAHVNTEPLDILWSSRDGSVSIEFMLQAELRCKEVRFPERFFFFYRIHPWHWTSPTASLPLLSRLRTRGAIPPSYSSWICA
jgi:hypothetical protein